MRLNRLVFVSTYCRSNCQLALFVCVFTTVGLAKRVRARLLLASTSEVYGGTILYAAVTISNKQFFSVMTVTDSPNQLAKELI